MIRLTAFSILGVLAIAACAEPPVTPTPTLSGARRVASVVGEGRTYVLVAGGTSLPQDLVARVEAAGGTLTSAMDGVGVAVATSDDPDFAARAAAATGLDVAEDMMVQFTDPNEQVIEAASVEELVAEPEEQSHAIGGHDRFRLAQWAPDAVNAPAAWATGALGAGARVAILDGGLFSGHPDLAANIDVARSRSFVPGQPFNNDLGTFWHGTHVAGIVAAVSNTAPGVNSGVVGIAPRATIIGVKVLHGGSGEFSWVTQGIVYAATPIAEGGAGAHIINLSLGAAINKGGKDVAHLLNSIKKAVNYAKQRGVTVIAAAGNNAIDLDHSGNLVFVPAMSGSSIAVSATGPIGWAVPGTPFDLDRPASYTNFGQSAITLAGPGGDFVLPGSAMCSKPTQPSGSIMTFCWVFDMVISTSRTGWTWAAGTSQAAPAVAGVAALVVGKYGPMSPSQLEGILRKSADDLGKPGNDDFYGRGRVNALKAVQ